MADTTDFRNGLTLQWKDGLWTIVEFMHVKPGKGGAFVRAKLKNVKSGKVVDTTFRSGEKVQTARVERHQFQYLYEDELGLHFMHAETFEQTSMPADLVAGRQFVKEGGLVDVLIHAETGEYLTAEAPAQVELIVAETEPGLKGDTATGATKSALLESGGSVNVPLFINEGDLIRVDTKTGDYVTRVSQA